MRALGRLAAVHAHLPGRAMAGGGVLLVLGDVVVVHASEEIVGGVVLAHVGKAEAPVFILLVAPLGSAVRRGRLAARPFAGRMLFLAQPAILVRLDPDAVEQRRWWRFVFHDRTL